MENIYDDVNPKVLKKHGQKDWFDLAKFKSEVHQRYEESVLYYTQYIKDNPWNNIAFNNRSNCFAKLGEFQKAYDDAKSSIRTDPSKDSAYRRKAEALLGKLEI